MKQLLPNPSTLWGIGLMGVLALVAFVLSRTFLPQFAPPVLAVLLGMLLANTLLSRIPTAWSSGFRFCSTWVLRTAIVFYGFKVVLADVLVLGWVPLLIDLVVVSSVLLLGYVLARALRMDKETGWLVALGSAICGAAAVMGGEAVLRNDSRKTTIAVSTVVLFGTLSMFLYPFMYRMGCLSALPPAHIGIYTGSTVHEVAQVVAAGSAMGNAGIEEVAVTTKMLRVILLAPVLLSLAYWRVQPASEDADSRRRIPIPWFALLFVVAILVHAALTALSAEWGVPELYKSVVSGIRLLDDFGLSMAMVALGMGATWQNMRRAGYKPFLLAFLLFLWLLTAGYGLAYCLA